MLNLQLAMREYKAKDCIELKKYIDMDTRRLSKGVANMKSTKSICLSLLNISIQMGH